MEFINKILALLERGVVALEAIAKSGGAPAAPADAKTATSGKGGKATSTKAEKTAPSADETNAALTELKQHIDEAGDKGIQYARKVMKAAAGVEKMAEIPEDKRAAVIVAAAAELEAYKKAQAENEESM